MNNAQDGMQTVVASNFLISFTMSFSMNYLWGMINCIQMLVYLPLLNLTFPGHTNMFFSILISVATFDIIPKIDDINDALFNFKHTIEPTAFNSLGFE